MDPYGIPNPAPLELRRKESLTRVSSKSTPPPSTASMTSWYLTGHVLEV